MNLLNETIEYLQYCEQTPDNITFIGSETTGHCCTWKEFGILADVEYDPGFGAQEVASDLVIWFDNGGKMYRHEYDGSEGWCYQRPVGTPLPEPKPIKRLVVLADRIGWETLEEMQRDD